MEETTNGKTPESETPNSKFSNIISLYDNLPVLYEKCDAKNIESIVNLLETLDGNDIKNIFTSNNTKLIFAITSYYIDYYYDEQLSDDLINDICDENVVEILLKFLKDGHNDLTQNENNINIFKENILLFISKIIFAILF